MQETMGWRHFRVIQCRKGVSGVAFVQMQASCEPATQLWLNSSNLKDRDLWAAGWLQKSQMEDPQGGQTAGVSCRACSGSGTTPCPLCDGTGAVLMAPSALGSAHAAVRGGVGPAASQAAAAAAAAGARGGGGGGGGRSISPLTNILGGSRIGGGGGGGGGSGSGSGSGSASMLSGLDPAR
ncbi:hypothetical protein TSOC_010506 [Tetrabaena socialis]|uniref:Uncharacterized protein n=1 Tax=Tetrabaena socialis TaxID=47790 RepID=A0A2J7ZT33_9CHLO|nr:hypothetical protein TSOC_010506 [Tetrabaena socialis]|eukprot:PNH03429.1 hypothetical protein TSOC_010506 [Tetrabaena socialis]